MWYMFTSCFEVRMSVALAICDRKKLKFGYNKHVMRHKRGAKLGGFVQHSLVRKEEY